MLRLKKWEFVLSEMKRFFSSIPQIVLFIGALVSAFLMYTYSLSEVNCAILEGIMSGYIFYLFVDVLPKSERRASSSKKVAGELNTVLTNIHTLKSHVKDEVLASGQQVQNQSKFFNLLERMVGTHMPTTNNMRRIKGTTPATATQPMQFQHSNFEEVLYGELVRLVKRLESLERTSAIYGLSDLDEELMKSVSELPNRQLASSGIRALGHINNTPAMFGTDFDWIEEALLKVKAKLESDWRIKFE
jgi:hypothetical protein